MTLSASPPAPAIASQDTPSSPIAKARLIQVALNNASRARVSVTAHALLAHIIADTWWSDDGWASQTSQASFATRLGVSSETIRRVARELDAAGVALYRAGRGTRRSRFVVPSLTWAPTPHPQGEVPTPVWTPTPHQRGDIPIPITSTSSRRASNAREAPPLPQDPPAPQTSPTTTPAAADAQPPATNPPTTDREPPDHPLVAILTTRPVWLSENRPWLDRRAALKLAPRTSIDAIHVALRATRQRAASLNNPAGYFRRALEAPDPRELQRQREARERAEQRRARAAGATDPRWIAQQHARLAARAQRPDHHDRQEHP